MTVGDVAGRTGVTVRTLHHYDRIGLLVPSHRSAAGYRLYTEADLIRLQHVVVYRRLGFGLHQITALLGDPRADVTEHLRRQRAAVSGQLEKLRDLLTALDQALENAMTDQPATPDDMRALFGDQFDDYQDEARQRWGETDAWKQSEQRTRKYTKPDWEHIKAEADQLRDAFLTAFRAGQAPTSDAAMDTAEAHRLHITRRFYQCSPAMHRQLGDLYVSDARFTASYDDSLAAPGLAGYVREAIYANAARHGD
jgi:DNA-binding transcriptional MerR regulator